MITAEVLADSVNSRGDRVTTLELEMPKFLLAQFNTHRVFSRNAASSRAIPTRRVIDRVLEDPVEPLEWRFAQKGMVAGAVADEVTKAEAVFQWGMAKRDMIARATRLADLGLAKESVNRLLEPFLHVSVLVTATEWNNFFHLRMANTAQPEMRALARAMFNALDQSTPRRLEHWQWHLPFADKMSPDSSIDTKLMVVAARCARISYETHDGDLSPTKDLQLAEKLLKDGHLSPFEHACRPSDSLMTANLRGWISHRTILEHRGLA